MQNACPTVNCYTACVDSCIVEIEQMAESHFYIIAVCVFFLRHSQEFLYL